MNWGEREGREAPYPLSTRGGGKVMPEFSTHIKKKILSFSWQKKI